MALRERRNEPGREVMLARPAPGPGAEQAEGHRLRVPASWHLGWSVPRWVARKNGARPDSGRPSVKGLRRRRESDLGDAVRLLRVVHLEDGYPVEKVDARPWLEDRVLDAWVVERLGRLVGHVAIATVGTGGVSGLRWREITGRSPVELAEVSRLFVRPGFRDQGIGTALLDAAEAEIRARGLLPVAEVVSASEDGIRMFEDRGWRLLAMDPWGPDGSGLLVHRYSAPAAGADPSRST